MRAFLYGVFGSATGLLAGYFLFSGTSTNKATQITRLNSSQPENSDSLLSRRGRRQSESSLLIDSTHEVIHLPLAYWEKLDITSFESDKQSPWAAEHDAFAVSEEMMELCQLEERQCETIRQTFLAARENHMTPQWNAPGAVRQEGDAVMFEIAPAPAELEATIRASIVANLGEDKANLFMDKVGATLDWEFGGFGRLRRVVEVSVLPDDTLSLRESLRRTTESIPPHMNAEQARVYQKFETRARQYRVDHLPPAIAALVKIEGPQE